ncbi:membrane-spanning 4-domains subfamily A member 4D-like isoform X1 [Nerophis ophidion]|uniref:membrane-spanning 4-domains subfamily A member 4D-like isoform X1 n=1 Tax=Nerophis ophidion TaxID=159077 RepID=UPI002ADFD965|nr:membrane-spanning 4-domains subfamily A member 4D-like isoform X1 [Nerophis ophidion]
MDDRTSTPTTTSEVTRGQQNADLKASPSSKPLHRFLQKEPQSLGVAIGICGCAELIMGCVLFRETMTTSGKAYIPFWQGGLFLICGILSVYTGVCPSKKMVTVCLSMYVMSILGVFVSSIYRIISFFFYWFVLWQFFADPMGYNRAMQLLALDCIMVTFSACVAVILIFLSVVARLALKSTNTQVIFQRISTPQTDTTSQL